MAEQFILARSANGVRVLTLNRPDVLNSFNVPMARELAAAVQACATDDRVRAVLLTGAGRGFCAGQDLSAATPQADGTWPDLAGVIRATYTPVIHAIRKLEKPVVCAVNGVAAGAGANIALCADLTIASTGASFIQSFAKLGLLPDAGGTWLLPRLVGLQRAAGLAMLADKLPATDAKAMGLIWDVAEPDQLMPAATALAERLAQMPTRGLGLAKRAFNESLANDFFTQLEREAEIQSEAGRTADFAEGVRAFLEKRAPVFTGR
ncbi:MAG: 2-(1,2-epoxy-1,2-dihydrophenyl)acetyl-CoA isomerase [Gemmatimonadetes bacterium]|nr:2-(1,2-epoxy-1,2-dihydrophenyl)acetyl-CoA isomerase [Gemmatimonadota bacterium]